MHHNCFVYADPSRGGRFVWFPWDLNESMLERTQTGCPAPGSVLLREIVEAQSGIDADWPLIRYLLADATYLAVYRKELRAFLDGAFAQAPVIARMERTHALIAPWVVGPEAVEAYPYTNTTQAGFKSSLTGGDSALEPHVKARRAAVEAALE
jgi:spore coat protein H